MPNSRVAGTELALHLRGSSPCINVELVVFIYDIVSCTLAKNRHNLLVSRIRLHMPVKLSDFRPILTLVGAALLEFY